MAGKTQKGTLLRLSLALLCLEIVQCWIVRLPCKQEAEFTIVVEGRKLENSNIASFVSLALEMCEAECVANFDCKSINYHKDEICELNSKMVKEVSGNLTEFEGWSYRTTDYNTSNIGALCHSLNPCESATYCIDTCICPGYQCVNCPPPYELKYQPYCTPKEITNIALNKPSYQHGVHVYGSFVHTAWKGNDGNRDGFYGNCAITQKHHNSFWAVDLGGAANIETVAIKSGNHWGINRINPFYILVGNYGSPYFIFNPVCAYTTLVPKEMKFIRCNFKNVRYVVAYLGYRAEHLQICELEVYGYYL